MHNKTIDEIKQSGKINDLKTEKEIFKNIINVRKSEISTVASSGYSTNKVVAYAKTYALKKNKKYKSFSKNCTNFVSQSVYAGGKKMTIPNNFYKDKNKYGAQNVTSKFWYMKYVDTGAGTAYGKTWKWSSAWSGVEDFAKYWSKNGATIKYYTSKTQIQNNLKLGDVVQLYNGERWYHTIIITGGGKGNWKYSGNTSDRKDYPLSKVKTSKYRVIRIK